LVLFDVAAMGEVPVVLIEAVLPASWSESPGSEEEETPDRVTEVAVDVGNLCS
jgi:hypothetical protein